MLPPYLGQLDAARQEVFHKLAAFDKEFILAGGTAIMLQIGHRESYDFDCFTNSKEDINPNLFRKIRRVFGQQTYKILENSEMIFAQTPQSVELNFVWYPYEALQKTIPTSSLDMFHLDDLVSSKANTLGRRPQWRDYVDIFFLIKWDYYSIDTIVDLAEKKYGGEFNSKLFAKQLTYFDDVEVRPTVFLKESYSEKEIKSYLAKQAQNYIKMAFPI